MSKEIRMYVEGGGDQKATVQSLRRGLSSFFGVSAVRGSAKWRIVPCGTRRKAFDGFKNANEQYPEAFSILLVDSEEEVVGSPKQHLQKRDRWDLTFAHDDKCHLMVRVMESWFLADVDALKGYYGEGFRASRIPPSSNIENIEKPRVYEIMREATMHTKTKGEYHKTRHAPELLEIIDSSKVRAASPHCESLFAVLNAYLH